MQNTRPQHFKESEPDANCECRPATGETVRTLIRRAERLTGKPMEMAGVQGVSMRMMVGRADGAPTFSMRHFTVEPGGHTPRHSHNYEHEVFVLEGAGTLEHDGEIKAIGAGDAAFVKPNTIHQFVNTGSGPLKFICIVPISFDCGQVTPGS